MDSVVSASEVPKGEEVDRLSRWSKKWSDNQIGWHNTDVNHILLQHGKHIIPEFSPNQELAVQKASCTKNNGGGRGGDDSGVRVLVPLCGKTVDMAFLANQSGVDTVVGVEGIRAALEEFQTEHPYLEIEGKKEASSSSESMGVGGKFERLIGRKIELLRGDFFDLTVKSSLGGRFHVVWDRASMVAIQPPLREEYVAIMGNVLKPGGKILLATLDRREGTEEGISAGPPFSVDEAEVRRLFEGVDWVESVTLVDEYDEFETDPSGRDRWRGKGVTALFELCFVIKAKG